MGVSGILQNHFHNPYGNYRGYYLTLKYNQSDETSLAAISTNTTTLTVELYIGGRGGGFHIVSTKKRDCDIYIDNQLFRTQNTVGFDKEDDYYAKLLHTVVYTVYHNEDGTATVALAGKTSATTNSFDGVATVGSLNPPSTVSLAQIPRPSTSSLANSLEVGKSVTININKNKDNLKHSLYYSFDGKIWNNINEENNKIDSSYEWFISESIAENFTNTNSNVIYIKTDTYVDNNFIGSTQLTSEIKVTEEIGKPILSNFIVKQKENNKLEEYVLGKSEIEAIVNAQTYGGAEIKYFVYNINGTTYNISPSKENPNLGFYSFLLKNNLGDIATSLNFKVSVYAIDSRGFQSTILNSDTFKVLDYFAPIMRNVRIIRGNLEDNIFEENPNGKRFKIHFTYNISPLWNGENYLNEKKVSFFYTINDGNSSTPIDIVLPAYSSDENGYYFIPNLELDKDSQYKIYLTIKDLFSSATEILPIRGRGILLNFGSNGYSAAIGGKAIEDKFTIFYPTLFQEGIEYKKIETENTYSIVNLNQLSPGWYCFTNTPPEGYNYPLKPQQINELGLVDEGVIEVLGVSDSNWKIQKLTYLSQSGDIIEYCRAFSNGNWSSWTEGANAASEIDIEKIVIPSDTTDGFIPVAQDGKLAMDNIKLNQISVENESDTIPVVDTGKLVPKDADSVFELFKESLDGYMSNYILEKFYPVGSIYISAKSDSPSTLFGGTWEQITGKYLLASNTSGERAGSNLQTNINIDHNHIVPVAQNTANNYFGYADTYGVWEGTTPSSSVFYFSNKEEAKINSSARGAFNVRAPYTSSPLDTSTTASFTSDQVSSALHAYQVYVWKRTA